MNTDHEVKISTRVIAPASAHFRFEVASGTPLLEVLIRGAKEAGEALLPNDATPLDQLRNVLKHDEIGQAIQDLTETVGSYVNRPHTTHDFAIELVRVIRVNNRSRVAPESSMTPHQILDLFGLEYQEFTLYRDMSTEILPLETPIPVRRGDVFAAQKDGRYGSRG